MKTIRGQGTENPSQPEYVDAGLPPGATGWFTTRAGGCSAAPWDSLNLALHVGDEPAAVLANRATVAAHVHRASIAGGCAAEAVVFPEQVHGAGVAVITERDPGATSGFDPSVTSQRDPGVTSRFDPSATSQRDPGVTSQYDPGVTSQCDAVVTRLVGVPVGVLVADCLPVLLADPVAGVVAAAHAGRRGLVAGVIQATLAAMAELGANPEHTAAVIGPSICGRCYEVPAAMRDEVAEAVPGSACVTAGGAPGLDLPAGAAAVLASAGVSVVVTGLCTAQDPRFYSYRRDGVTGRFAGIVTAGSARALTAGSARALTAGSARAVTAGSARAVTAGSDPIVTG